MYKKKLIYMAIYGIMCQNEALRFRQLKAFLGRLPSDFVKELRNDYELSTRGEMDKLLEKYQITVTPHGYRSISYHPSFLHWMADVFSVYIYCEGPKPLYLPYDIDFVVGYVRRTKPGHLHPDVVPDVTESTFLENIYLYNRPDLDEIELKF